MTPTTSPPATLEAFLERLQAGNPFLANRVVRAWAADAIDVPGIHEAEFRRLTALARQAHQEDRGIGVVIWGEAGVGKSHLLARLGRWARVQSPPACFVYLHNLQASPERLPRYVLRAVLSVLDNAQTPPLYRNPLFRVLNDVLRKALQMEGRSRGSWAQIEGAFRKLLDLLAARDPSHGVLFDRVIYDVLFRFYKSAHPVQGGREERAAGLALRWLSGEALDPAEARTLGLSPDVRGQVALADNQHVKQVLVALTRLAGLSGSPFLLCFDQVDNLDEDQVKALARFLHDLLDSAGNLLLVTTGVRETMLGFVQRGVITGTSWDRVGQVELPLGRLRGRQGRELLEAHLQRFLKDVGPEEVKELARQDLLFPLGSGWLEQRLRHLADYRPRDLLTWAAERWRQQQDRLQALPGRQWLEHWQEGVIPGQPRPEPQLLPDAAPAVDQAVARRLEEETQRRRQGPVVLPPSETHLQDLVYMLLKQFRVAYPAAARPEVHLVIQPHSGPRKPYDLEIRQRRGQNGHLLRVGMRFLVTENGNTAAAALRLLAKDAAPPDRVVLVTDEREPPPLGSKGSRWLDHLERVPARFRHLRLAFEDYAELDALRAVLEAAHAGQLDLELPSGQSYLVSEQDVVEAYRRLDRYLAQPLLCELLGEEAAGAAAGAPTGKDPLAGVSDKDIREFVAAQVGMENGVPLQTVAERYADRLAAGTQAPIDSSRCLARVREVTTRMAQDGVLEIDATDQRLSLRH
jgi:hypothetical protein